MLIQLLSKLNHKPPTTTTILLLLRRKTTSAEYVASRNRDPTFEKLMDKYKNLFKVISIQNLILGTTTTTKATASPPAVSVDFLNRLSQRLHLNRGATHFLRKYPHIFHIFHHPTKLQPFCTLTESALKITQQEAAAINASLPLVINRLVRMLSMSVTKTLPLRAIFKVFRELGLPDDFEDSVILKKSNLFALVDSGIEPNTHLLKLVGDVIPKSELVAAVDSWRVMECCKEDVGVDRNEILYSFKHSYPPGMKLRRSFKAKVKEWEKLKYVGPYEVVEIGEKRKSKIGTMEMEKRAVGIVHEFLSLTVEKMVEVEKISHFRKWFGIDLNIRDLFLDHPGIFYLSTKGYRHTVFLREAYERGCLIEPNPVYEARRKLLDLVILGRRGLSRGHSEPTSVRQGDDGIDELKTDSDED
ncbi:PREDICTED: protein ROOT PRIMORDIUM DEFECTIVE 1 [Nicotiana attenuata]|uniref:Protein root primordium defective 1 n=1 Tax=Nicotiana attenuata TaxID=49451 RepID=A0A314LE76_NICAT|nr:PREDICTED: protein ROOT PRIMORDIUM DEFECTIVE 1 [Nicotiana attenuata]OIT39852.1 protein root primordium defective 1 [Nicotiana attenuata]